jgi:hypothetical protein
LSIDIYDYFDEDEDQEDCLLLVLDEDYKSDFLSIFKPFFKSCYISNKDLEESIEAGLSHEETLGARLPNRGNIKSGDFGEILTTFILENLESPAEGIKKWRWKEAKDSPVHKIDVVLSSVEDIENPSKSDCLILGEVKGKATDLGYSQLQKAIDDIKGEKQAKIAKTIIWAHDRAIKDKDLVLKKRLERFIKSTEDNYGEYSKVLYAIAVIDEAYVNDDIDETNFDDEMLDEINLLVISLKEMKEIYEALFSEIASG